MELEVSISKRMDNEEAKVGMLERGVIRMPEQCRQKLQFRLGEMIYLRNRSGKLDMYRVAEAYKEDVSADPYKAYVTSGIHQRLFLRERGVGNINKVENITLGCDPEAVLVNTQTGIIEPAHQFFRKYGGVGHDGQLIEFRPQPSIYAEEVTYNLWQLIQQARAILNNHAVGRQLMIFGCSSYGNAKNNLTAGFHLHYGFPYGMLGRSKDVKILAHLIVKVFDFYVGIPSMIPEGNKDIFRRTKKFVDYGKPGGFNLDNRTFEFRMPGGINLIHPVLTRGLLALGAVVAEDVASRVNTCTDCFLHMNEMSKDTDLHTLYPNIPSLEKFYSIVCNPDIGMAKSYFQVIKEDIRKMVGYEKRAQGVESYFSLLDSETSFNNNIEQNWGGFYNA